MSTERCRKCGQAIEGEGFGSPETGWEHPFSCPPNPDCAHEWVGGPLANDEYGTWCSKCAAPRPDPIYLLDTEVYDIVDEVEPLYSLTVEGGPYTGRSLRTVTLCEESGFKASAQGTCVLHNGDACLYEYRHPYDNATDRWKKAAQWGEPLRRSAIMTYERWFVSTEGSFAHYWSHEWGTSMTLCGRRIHRDGYVADSKDPICSRCEAKRLNEGTPHA